MKNGFLVAILSLALALGIALVEAWVGMFLFNWVAGLLGWAFVLTFWQAFAICILLTFIGGFFKSSSKNK